MFRLRSCASSRMIEWYSRSSRSPCVSASRMPSVISLMAVRLPTWSWKRTLQPTTPPSSLPSSSAMRAATERAAMRRGCVWPIRPALPRPMSSSIFGSWVVLPEPVSPQTMTTGFASIAAQISSRRALIGSAGSKRMRQHPFDVAGDEVDFQVHLAALLQPAERRDFQGVRDQVHFEGIALDAVDGQADAVDADRAFARHVFRELFRYPEAHHAAIPADDLADAVDVAAHQMAAERIAQGEGFLQVHLAGAVEAAGETQSLGGDIGGEALAGERGHGQAYALHRDRVADRDVGQAEAGTLDLEGSDAHDLPHRLHDAREHGGEGYRKGVV